MRYASTSATWCARRKRWSREIRVTPRVRRRCDDDVQRVTMARGGYMIEYVKLAVDLLKGLAWPAAFFGTMFLFRVDVRALLLRLVKAGPTGVEFDRQLQKVSKPWSGGLNKLPSNRHRTAGI